MASTITAHSSLLVLQARHAVSRRVKDDEACKARAADGADVDLAEALGAHAQVAARQHGGVLRPIEADHTAPVSGRSPSALTETVPAPWDQRPYRHRKTNHRQFSVNPEL